MNSALSKLGLLGAALAASMAAQAEDSAAASQSPSNEVLYEIIQAQQAQLDALQNNSSEAGSGRVSIGGYGELHYNSIEDADDEIDFHRFVLFFGYDFNDRIRFFSEFELEHALAGEGKEGEVELEQAYVEGDINDNLQAKAGVFLIPVGVLNETHEPPTFYGVERNNVEKNIIPTTWWEAGAAMNGRFGQGFSWDLALHSGLQLDDSYKIRNGRQKVSEATANAGAITGRIKYSGIRGLELASTVQHQFDPDQGQLTDDDIDATLFEAHAILQRGIWAGQALYAHWNLSGEAPAALGRDKQLGYLLEASVKPFNTVGFFTRYSVWDNEAGNDADTDWQQIDIGVNWWPHPDVVLKADIFDAEQNDNSDSRGFNLGVGYNFGS